MSEEEKKTIEEQYKKGLVNLSDVIEPLINQFKIDYSLDIQQCRLVINYLLMERDFDENYYEELEEEVQELKEKNKEYKKIIKNLEYKIIRQKEQISGSRNKYHTNYYKACAFRYTSIILALNSIGVDGSYNNRKKIAQKNGIKNYSGKANQNLEMLDKLKKGKLMKV